MARICPFNGCGTELRNRDVFCCRPHWCLLTAEQRGRVATACQANANGAIDGDELRRIQQAVLNETKLGGSAG